MTNSRAPAIAVPITEMFVGRAVPFGPRGEPSAIEKCSAPSPWTITVHGLAGDEQGDAVHHGGSDKALHHYPREHYDTWQTAVPALAPYLEYAAAFGENISTFGLSEPTVCIGDVFKAGSAVLQVSQARQPCWKLNVRFGHPAMAQLVQGSGRTGWYYRVLEPGRVHPGDALSCIDRPQPSWTLARVLDLLYHRPLELESLRSLSEVPQLAQGWRRLIENRIARGRVEDWSTRLSQK
jgi:MOSC domain-containing protein YiiM